MKDMEERILQYLQEHPKGNRKASDMKEAFRLTEKEDIAVFNAALEKMTEEKILFTTVSGQYETREQANVSEGRLSVNKAGTGFLDREDGSSVRIEERSLMFAMDGDTVLVQSMPWMSEGRVIAILDHAKEYVIGTYTDNGRGLHFVPDDEKLQSRLIRVNTDMGFTPVDGLKVRCRIEKYGSPLVLRVEKTIGHRDDPGVDIEAVLLEHDIDPVYPQSAMDQAEAVPFVLTQDDLSGREDLRSECTITIDGDDSKDFDDAVSVTKADTGWILKVSIADVSWYVTEDSPLDLEARKRGCSTYVTDRAVGMLPHILSNGICSLNPKEDRLTLTCSMHVLPDGTVHEYKVYPSVICSNERMTYNNVNRILDQDAELCEKYSHILDLIHDLRDCADAIRRNRVGKGAIEFDSDESVIEVDAQGHPLNVYAKQRGHAEEMIEDCMIAANVCVADLMHWQDIPSIYRIHEEPQAKRIRSFVNVSEFLGLKLKVGKTVHPRELQAYLESIQDTDYYPVLSSLLLRCMQKAKYDSRCVGHFGLAEEEYLHFTSPIRRYPDLIVHRMLRKYYFNTNLDVQERLLDEQKCADYAEQSSIRERISQDAEYACDDMKKAEYMMDHIGMEAEGIVTGVTAYGLYVKLKNTVEGLVHLNTLTDDYYVYFPDRMELAGSHTGKIFRIGMTVKVKVTGADKDEKTVDFRLVGKNGIRREKKTGRSRSARSTRLTERRRYGRKNRK